MGIAERLAPDGFSSEGITSCSAVHKSANEKKVAGDEQRARALESVLIRCSGRVFETREDELGNFTPITLNAPALHDIQTISFKSDRRISGIGEEDHVVDA